MATKNPTPLLYQLREGSVSDPFVDKVENVKLVAGRAILDEIPVKQFGIIVDGHQETGTNNPTGVQFYVDYTNGVLYFEPTKTGSVTVRYKGRGVVQIPSDRIFHPDAETNETLDVTFKRLEAKVEEAKTKGDVAENQGNTASTQAAYAKTQGDYSKAQGDYAKAQGDHGKSQGDYAKAQGDIAKTKSDLANEKATLADEKAQYADAAAKTAVVIWLDSVASFNQIASTYTSPVHGNQVQVEDTGYIYRFENGLWKSYSSAQVIPPTKTRHKDRFVATQGQKVFTLSKAYFTNQDSIDVFVLGIKQASGTDYTETSPTIITLTEGANAGDVVEAVYFRTPEAQALELIEQVRDAEQATSAANSAATNANTKATLADQKATAANTATNAAITATSQANTARDSANAAATNATTQANHAKSQGDYAKAQGDLAKGVVAGVIPNATQNASGLMSAADKTALDNGQKWKLTNNDGTVITPSNGTNFDSLLSSGMYRFVNDLGHSGGPGGNYYNVIVQGFNSNTATQLWIAINTENVFVRRYENGSWKPFRRVTEENTLTNTLMGNKITVQSNANFIGKIQDSTTANPHSARRLHGSTLLPPSSFTLDMPQAELNKIVSLDGQTTSLPNSGSGVMPQHLFSFNLIEHVQRTYGTIPGSTTADKVVWLKANIKSYLFRWHGHGSSPSGSKAYLQRWIPLTSSWFGSSAHTGSSAQRVETGASSGNEIDSNGFVHLIAYTDPSDGTTASVINTDYVELQVELSTDIKTNLLLGGVQGHKLTQDDGRSFMLNGSDKDLNTIITPGYYYVQSNVQNKPALDSGFAGYLEVYRVDSGYVKQRFTVAINSKSRAYERLQINNIWTDWMKISDDRTYISTLMGNSLTDQSIANFIGKVMGSTTANPHITKRTQYGTAGIANTLLPPSSTMFLELDNNDYPKVSGLDGVITSPSNSVNGNISQMLFSFNLIEHVQRTYGTIPGSTTADKVAWLKANISKLTFNWWGFGSSTGGNRATIEVWTGSNWTTNWNTSTASSPSKLSNSVSGVAMQGNYIGTDGFIHFLAFAQASDGTTPSVINTDYVELVVDLDTSLKKNLAPTWIDAVLQNGWVEFDSARKPKYSLSADGYVFLRGAVKSGTFGASTPITTLPSGFRPAEIFYTTAVGGSLQDKTVTIRINTTGQLSVIAQGTSDNTFVSLDGIRFPTN